MGVLGLWKLLEPCGKPVPLESLEDKILAVDVSIWLNQVIKGYRDGQHGAMANAHLLGVFHRVCKLLTYRIKPVFVFDGGVPALKQQTLSARRLRKAAASQAADRTSQKLVQNLLRQEAMRAVLGAAAPLPLAVAAASRPDPFALPPAPPAQSADAGDSESGDSSSDSESEAIVDRLQHDLHSFDFESDEFRNLAPHVKHDILSDLKDTRKQNSWGKLDQMPKDADTFSDFQMERLRKRKKFQDSMDDVEAEITKRNTELLHMGIDLPGTVTAHSMASRAGTFLVLSHPSADKQTGDGSDGAGAAAAAAGSATAVKSEPDEDEDEGALADAADTMEYLAGTDLFGGGGSGGGGSAARVDRRMEELSGARRGAPGGAAGRGGQRSASQTEADTAQVFSEMGKKYSNLYLKFSAQWLEDEKKADVKTKRDSPQKRKAPDPPPRQSEPPAKKPASKPESVHIPTLEEVTRDLAKISAERKKASRSGQFKKPYPVAPKKSTKSSKTSRSKVVTDSSGAAPTAASSDTGMLTVSINPVSAPAEDDLFSDVFSAPSAVEDDVGVMSDSEESDGEDTDGGRDSADAATAVTLKSTSPAPGNVTEKTAGRSDKRSDDGIVPSSNGPPKDQQLENCARGTAEVVTCAAADRPTEARLGKEDATPATAGHPGKLEETRLPSSKASPSREESVSSMSSAEPPQPVTVGGSRSIAPAAASPTNTASNRRPPPVDSASLTSDGEDADDPGVLSPSRGRDSPLVLPVSPRRGDATAAVPTAAHTAAPAASNGISATSSEAPAAPTAAAAGPSNDTAGPSASTEVPSTFSAGTSSSIDTLSTSTAGPSASNTGPPAPAAAEPASPAVEDSVWDGLDDSELRGLAEDLAREQMSLLEERGRQQRDAAGVSDDMYRDVQALLEQFGIPYVVSPKEAEAQCAFLEMAGLTEGTITDDSDIWLFGGRRVYKNFFNQKKFVECYQAGDIQGSLGLTRGQLVCVALLTGSDYTLGVESVGCVRALEILAEFPGEGLSGLRAFRRWWEQARAGAGAAARTPIRRSLTALKLTHGFPSEAVMTAYLEPEVDTSREPFSWAPPDPDGLRHLAAAKFGWGAAQTDTVLNPVLDRYKQKQGQRRLDAFFTAAYRRDAPTEGSKRLQEAVRRVRGDDPPSPPSRGAEPSGPEPGAAADPDALLDDGLDELLAAVEEPLDDAGDDDGAGDAFTEPMDEWDGMNGADGLGDGEAFEEPSGVESTVESAQLPDVVPRPRAVPRGSASRGARGRGATGGRGRGRARPRKPVSFSADEPGPSSAAAPSAPATSRSSPAASRSAPVSGELSSLDPVARERVLLVRRLRDRANLIRSQIQHENPPAARPAAQKPSTRQVRAQMMEGLLKHNPRLRLEREAQLRRRLGLPPLSAGRGRSCRDPAARREESFSEVLAAPDRKPDGAATRLLSERRQAEARRQAAELLRAGGRRRGQRAGGRRQAPVRRAPAAPRAGGLSESSDSD
ncbi:DNA excision repair protein ERCC-5-like [Amphibalanus amphitrite]|uniref:DNA excision repair protein ERCC-5-like n=1 Tax=Amphibalanus amphitrite TaxID=1232801 RepID=UPI001C90706A|nr:DNA excision repair protein ERCC-5-like [Amphibalanus amphitrite]